MEDQKWIKRFMHLTSEIAKWSKDPSRKIGAIIVGNYKQIISQGYNGFPRGVNDSDERYQDRETKYKFVVHAEMNAILNALYNGSSVKGSTIFVSGLPVCNECAKAIIQSGIKEVIYLSDKYADTPATKASKRMFDAAGVKYTKLFPEKKSLTLDFSEENI